LDGGDGSNYVHRLDHEHLEPHAPVKVAHPLMLRAIAAAKKKNDSTPATRETANASTGPSISISVMRGRLVGPIFNSSCSPP
jgi:hypothetical protein